MNRIFDPHLFAFFSSIVAPFAMSSAKKDSSRASVCTLDLVCNLLRLKSFPSKRYLLDISLSPSWKASVSMAENIMLNSVVASTQPCLTPFVTGNGSENSPSFWTLASIPSWNWHTIAMNLAEHPNSLTTYCGKSFCKVDKGHVEVHILFLAFLLKLSCCEDHVYCSSVFPESTLAFWQEHWLFKVFIQSIQHDSSKDLPNCFTLCGEKKPSLRNSRMQQLSTYSKVKGILKSATIIEASLYCQ